MASLRAKTALLRGILDGQRAYAGPLWVALEVTRRCNTFCAGCYGRSALDQPGAFPDGRRDISFDVIQRICRELPPLGTREVFLAGLGEPLLHPRIFDILTALRKAGLRTQLSTNGILLTEAVAEAMVTSGPDNLRVTVWSTDSRQYAELHPGTNPALLGKGIEGLQRVARLRKAAGKRVPRLHLQAPLNRANFHDIDTRVRRAIEAGCDSLRFGYYRHFGRQFEYLCLVPDNLLKLGPPSKRPKQNFGAPDLARTSMNTCPCSQWGPTSGCERHVTPAGCRPTSSPTARYRFAATATWSRAISPRGVSRRSGTRQNSVSSGGSGQYPAALPATARRVSARTAVR